MCGGCPARRIATAGCGADDEMVSAKSAAIMDYGGAPLHLTWMKASHNTYEGSHTPGSTIAWHLGNTTNHIELDLRDTHARGTLSGNWTVAHGAGKGEETTRCGDRRELSRRRGIEALRRRSHRAPRLTRGRDEDLRVQAAVVHVGLEPVVAGAAGSDVMMNMILPVRLECAGQP
jgi:hypothetical protein